MEPAGNVALGDESEGYGETRSTSSRLRRAASVRRRDQLILAPAMRSGAVDGRTWMIVFPCVARSG